MFTTRFSNRESCPYAEINWSRPQAYGPVKIGQSVALFGGNLEHWDAQLANGELLRIDTFAGNAFNGQRRMKPLNRLAQ